MAKDTTSQPSLGKRKREDTDEEHKKKHSKHSKSSKSTSSKPHKHLKDRKTRKAERQDVADLPEDLEQESEVEAEAQVDKVASVIETPTAIAQDQDNADADDDADALTKAQVSRQKRKAKKAAALESSGGKDSSTKSRFIVFIGNLPYTTTTATLKKHFASVNPDQIRHRTQRDSDPPRSKGFAFLEFERYDHMESCLKLFHHSKLDDGKSPARRINVELTVGGGGSKSEGRKEKLKSKNEKLNVDRAKSNAEGKDKVKSKGKKNGLVAEPAAQGEIHPSRMAQMTF